MNTRGSASTIAATVYRGPAVENTHRAHIAVVDAAGRLVYAFDDPYRPTLPCSAVKPVQALAVVETGALERFGFDDADLALMCASHNSEEMHLERARAMLAKARLSEADLRCGGHPPISEEVERTWIKRDFTPTPICSNCSGKHVGMLAAARAMGADTLGYEHDAHPLQQRVKSTLAQLTALREDEIQWGTDGCNLPTPSFALDRLARIFAKLAEAGASGAELAGSADPAQAPTRHAALARIYRAMTTHSDLVAGKGRFCTALMNAFDATVVGKIGAEASYGLGIRADAHRVDGVTGALGIAVKIEDGASGILTAVVVELLHQLEIGTAAQRARLDAYRAPPVKNTVGIEVGRVELSIALQRLAGLAGSLISLARTNSHALGVDALEWLFLSLSLCLDIGLVNVAMLSTTLKHGFRPGFWLGLGSCFGDLAYAALALAGMTALLRFDAVRWIVWIGGAAMLLYLTCKMMREACVTSAASLARDEKGDAGSSALPPPNVPRAFMRGVLLAISSPSAIIWFAAVGGALIARAGAADARAASVFLGGFFMGGLSWTLALCAVASHGRKRANARLMRACHVVSAALFAFLAYSVIVDGYRDLIAHA